MAIRWTESAGKHGVEREDVIHAMIHSIGHFEAFDEPRREGSRRPDLWIGPQRDPLAPLLEVMAEPVPPRDLWVFHAMPARPKYLALLDQEVD